jgi:hypothetical protein
MAFNYPVTLTFSSFERKSLPRQVELLLKGMAERGRQLVSLVDVGELVFDSIGEWLDTKEVRPGEANPVVLLGRGRWARVDLELQLGRGRYFASLHTFPIQSATEGAGVQIVFDGRAYASIYEFEPRVEGLFDDSAKRDFLRFCIDFASLLNTESFNLIPDDGSLRALQTPDLIAQMLAKPGSARPGLLSGVVDSLVECDEVRGVWKLGASDPRLVRSPTGYCVLDFIQRFVED